ncbi:oxidoreductase [Kribbella sp. NPDC051620]|uniref:oxidoreductase n=1 Tax=Kribbella sp. NPDC051620 TaxID=3364120 RepID=UPI0037B47365
MSWSTSDIPDLTGRRVLVTGATSGLGYETALELLKHGAEVTIAARNPEKSEQAAAKLKAATGKDARILELDLAELASVEEAAKSFSATYDSLDILVNNAGVMAPPYRQTAEGFELQLGTNHLGHFALTARLLPLLLQAKAPRVVTVSSFMHKTATTIRQADFRAENGYAKWDAYSRSKLANLLFMSELDRRARAAGSNLVSVGSHPGYARTHLQSSGPQLGGISLEARLLAIGTNLVAQSAAAGAWPSLYAATTPGMPSGSYYGPSFFEYRGKPKLVHPSKAAQNPRLARDLWAWSVEATGVDAF